MYTINSKVNEPAKKISWNHKKIQLIPKMAKWEERKL